MKPPLFAISPNFGYVVTHEFVLSVLRASSCP